jgi:hypothetical protein
LSERIVLPLTPTSDRQCEASGPFPSREGTPGPLIVTEQGTHLLFWNNRFLQRGEAKVASYTFDGEDLGDWAAADGTNLRAIDIANVDDEVFVAGFKNGSSGGRWTPFVEKFALDGTIAWQLELGAVGDSHGALGLAGSEQGLHVVTRRSPADSAVAELMRYLVDRNGEVVSTVTLEADTGFYTQTDRFEVELASNGHLYVAGDEAIAEFDETGSFVFGQQLRVLQLAADDTGSVFALTRSSSDFDHYFLQRFGPNGGVGFSQEVPNDGDARFDVLTVTSDAIVLAGVDDLAPTLMRTDHDGVFVSSERAMGFERSPLTAVRPLPTGGLLVAGGVSTAFVALWPQLSAED